MVSGMFQRRSSRQSWRSMCACSPPKGKDASDSPPMMRRAIAAASLPSCSQLASRPPTMPLPLNESYRPNTGALVADLKESCAGRATASDP